MEPSQSEIIAGYVLVSIFILFLLYTVHLIIKVFRDDGVGCFKSPEADVEKQPQQNETLEEILPSYNQIMSVISIEVGKEEPPPSYEELVLLKLVKE